MGASQQRGGTGGVDGGGGYGGDDGAEVDADEVHVGDGQDEVSGEYDAALQKTVEEVDEGDRTVGVGDDAHRAGSGGRAKE
jgi:hypothetical protein